jgi:uncharacterized protein (UPF0147 family)
LLDRDEAIEILEEIARDPNAYPNARITAIRTLREMTNDEDDLVQPDDDLYPDQLAAHRKGKT